MERISLQSVSAHLSTITLVAGDSKTVGRSAHADIVVDDPSLSRLHARLTLDPGGFFTVEDLGSTNGLAVNGERTQKATLVTGDTVRFGFVEYLVGKADEAPTAQADQLILDQTIVRVAAREAPAAADRSALEALLATSRELMAFGDLPTLLDHVLDRLQPILKPDRSAILLVDKETGELTPRAVRPNVAYTSVSQFASSTVVRDALAGRDVLLITDAANQSRLQQAASFAGVGIQSAICVPLFGRTGAIGALYADRVGFGKEFTPENAEYAAAFAAHAAAALETAQLYEDRERHFRATLEAFAKAIDARDRYTAGHSERVTKYTLALARARGLPAGELETIRRGGMLHDIGKVGVPDAILLKPGPLVPAERELMEAHVTIGYRMLEALPFLEESLPCVRNHHERWDGKGYPDKLAGTAIPAYARLMGVADTYDAITSARPYRDALPSAEAARRLRADSGAQFDPEAIETFMAIEGEINSIREQSHAVAAVAVAVSK
jgi:putative nucleotidyltransferase with HDIG domain